MHKFNKLAVQIFGRVIDRLTGFRHSTHEREIKGELENNREYRCIQLWLRLDEPSLEILRLGLL